MSDPILHPLLQTIRGMCADEVPYSEIDQAVARAVDIAKDLEDLARVRAHRSPDQTVDMVTSIVSAMNAKPFPAGGFPPMEDIPECCGYCGSALVELNDEGYCAECDKRLEAEG